ncbi:unnamed protein product [Dracunculus medinensis]|uniref:Ral GTPase-activating protein subunit beta (Trinotate prediction) n=1 Tax=Dracunculus medinensis TaxID=318479 RepID=A0A0N4UK48_DRAME|nr:unnamed protein product [Dracunculus medinensis]
MYEEWPVLDLCDVKEESSLSFISKEASNCIAEILIRDIINVIDNREKVENFCLRIKTDEELSWIMQVITHSLSFSYFSNKECDTVHNAVRIYTTWLCAAATDLNIIVPLTLKRDPVKYTS